MKPEQFVQSLLFTVSVAALIANPAQGAEISQRSELREKRDISQLKQPSVLSQLDSQQAVPVTGVQVNSTAQGVEIILQTPLGEQLQVKPKSEGNTYIAEISNAQLRLPSGETFRQEKPVAGIAEITVNNQNANTILVTVRGEGSLPQVELFDSDEGLIFGLMTTASVPPTQPERQPVTEPAPPEQPESQTQPQPPSAEADQPIELVVTGDRDDDYNALNATTGTRTDTPLRDIPQSIQVIPRRVIEDQQVIRLDEALNNISNVIAGGFDTSSEARYTIRGFDDAPILIDGFRQYGFAEVPETANLERVEILKGPASILYGEIQPGGIINAVTKKPLAEPFYEAEVQFGNYGLIRPRIDLSGPLSDDPSVLYRLNFSYLNNESFRGFDQNFEQFFVAPVLAWKLGENTDFTIDVQYSNRRRPFDAGLVASGDRVVDVKRDRIINEPDDYIERTFVSTGYSLEHRFSDNWTLRSGFRYATTRVYSDKLTIPTGFDETTGIVDRVYALDDFYSDDYSLQSNVVGKFATGGIKHTLLFGLDLNRTNSSTFSQSNFFTPSQLDIFNPVYGATPRTALDVLLIDRESITDRLGIYLQDELAFFDNLKLLAGIRYETVEQQITNRASLFYPGGDTSQFNDAWTPRVGIVYQPLKEVSLYASYSQSFNPNIDSFDVNGNPLQPEQGEGYEVGVKTELLQGKLSATLSYFDITKQNVATPDLNFPGLGISVATGEQRSRGIELDVSGQILPGWNIIAAYAYTDAEVTADNNIPVGNRLSGVPRHSASLWTTYEIQSGNLQGLGFGVGLNYIGEREGDLENSFGLDSYFLTNAAIFYRRDNWRFGLNFKNIFDVDYITGVPFSRTSGIYPAEPFSVIGSVSVQF
ncbi:TonB-dependent siderophore receptor [Nostoc sp. UHCC 0302]|uniref:TonB-dependent siderophore receptor n=1 Tax=Nostoc sp. UHCC 0302 TaxID=3134896 RepID=UPI00311CC73C